MCVCAGGGVGYRVAGVRWNGAGRGSNSVVLGREGLSERKWVKLVILLIKVGVENELGLRYVSTWDIANALDQKWTDSPMCMFTVFSLSIVGWLASHNSTQ